MDTLLELIYQLYTEFNSAETPEFKDIIDPLDKILRSLVDTDEEADEYMNVVFELCAAYERQSYIESMKTGGQADDGTGRRLSMIFICKSPTVDISRNRMLRHCHSGAFLHFNFAYGCHGQRNELVGNGQPEKVYIQGEYVEPHPIQCVRIFHYLIEQQCLTFSFDMAVMKIGFGLLVVKAMVFNQKSSDGVAMTVTLFFIDALAGCTMPLSIPSSLRSMSW